MEKLKLTDLIDVNILQRIQESFSAFTGMAALITDEDGIPITMGSNFSDFCMQYTRKSELGCERCEECDKQGALDTLRNGRPAVYRCHAGLCDYAVPILVDGRFVGSFIGGQVSTNELDMDKIREKAAELGIDEEKYIEAAGRILVKPRDEINRAADFLYILGGVLSDMAYRSNQVIKESRKLERAAKSQTEFIMDMNSEFQSNMDIWIEDARNAVNSGDKDVLEKTIKQLLIKGPELVSNFSDSVEYAKMTDGQLELNETEYNMDNLLRFVCHNLESMYEDKAIVIIRQVDDDVPETLLGDEGRIGQVIGKVLLSAVQYNDEGVIDIHVSSERIGYATYITIKISDDNEGLSEDELENFRKYVRYNDSRLIGDEVRGRTDFSMVSFLLRQMSGKIQIESEKGVGTTFTISIPQLEV